MKTVEQLHGECLAAERVKASIDKNDDSLVRGIEDYEKGSLCVGYITGVVDAWCNTTVIDLQTLTKQPLTIKCEKAFSMDQVIRAFLKYTDDDPSIGATSPAIACRYAKFGE